MRKTLSILLVLVLCVSCLAACQKDEPKEGEKTKLVVAYGSNLTGAISVAVAKAEGFFEEEGLDVELLGFPAMPAAISAMASGDIDYAYIGHGAHALAMNGKATIIGLDLLSDGEKLIAKADSGIKTVADLKGKTVATQYGTTGEAVLNFALEQVGLTRKDVDVINMDMAACSTALISGQVDAACVYAPTSSTIMSQLGENALIVARTSDYIDNFVSLSSWCALQKTVDQRPEVTQKFMNAIVKSMEFRENNLDQAILHTAKLLKQDLALVLLGKDDGNWLSSQEVKKYFDDGDMEKWYTSIMEQFLADGKINQKADFSSYANMKFMIKACENLEK